MDQHFYGNPGVFIWRFLGKSADTVDNLPFVDNKFWGTPSRSTADLGFAT